MSDIAINKLNKSETYLIETALGQTWQCIDLSGRELCTQRKFVGISHLIKWNWILLLQTVIKNGGGADQEKQVDKLFHLFCVNSA